MNKYILFSNDTRLIPAIDSTGSVDTHFIDLEILGKEERQGHTNSLISRHTFDDVAIFRQKLQNTSLGVRLNPINSESLREVQKCIDIGVDVLML